jgi:hypothetical protein
MQRHVGLLVCAHGTLASVSPRGKRLWLQVVTATYAQVFFEVDARDYPRLSVATEHIPVSVEGVLREAGLGLTLGEATLRFRDQGAGTS